ncbi:hypothetical protein Tco_0242011 [Tanacetum coccineum]
MLKACPHHGFSELTQIDTFYNGLNENDQDSLNAAAGGNLLSKTTRDALNIIENKSKVCYSRNKSNVSRMNTNSRESSSKTNERIDKLADQISTLVEIVAKKVVTPATVKAVEESCVICGGTHAYYNCPNTDSNQSSVCAAMGAYNQVAPPNRVSNQMAPPGFAPVQNSQNRKLISNKEKLFELSSAPLNENCSAVLLKKLPKSLRPGKLSLPELTTTHMTLELADQSITRPKGVAEDVFDISVLLLMFNGEEITLEVNEVLGFTDSLKSGNSTSTDPIIATGHFLPHSITSEVELSFLEEIENYLSNGSIPPGIDDEDFDPEEDIFFHDQS